MQENLMSRDALKTYRAKKESGLLDQFGNNIDFPDSIMVGMTDKGLLGKWVEAIYIGVEHAVVKYSMKTCNIDKGDKNLVERCFEKAKCVIEAVTPVLEDLLIDDITGIEDIFVAVYGITSDEVYVLRRFLELYDSMGEWDTDYMWNDCGADRRLYDIMMRIKMPWDGKVNIM